MEAAGFLLDAERGTRNAERNMLANKDDPRSVKVFDPVIRGETDRFVYRFAKP